MLFEEPLEGRHLLENVQGEMSAFFFSIGGGTYLQEEVVLFCYDREIF